MLSIIEGGGGLHFEPQVISIFFNQTSVFSIAKNKVKKMNLHRNLGCIYLYSIEKNLYLIIYSLRMAVIKNIAQRK